jgi:phosphatidylserine decarboxylase
MTRHSYVDRETGATIAEDLYGDAILAFMYSALREHTPTLLRLLTSRRLSNLVGMMHFDLPLSSWLLGPRFVGAAKINLDECVLPPEQMSTVRELFERQIRYWECRPTPRAQGVVVSPADARVVVGSISQVSALRVKGKFFDLDELLGRNRAAWRENFCDADFAVFRLTPDMYHYNHTPVAGRVVDYYALEGRYHSCNPHAVVSLVTPYSKNRREVTILDTDVEGGTQVGLVAMIEVAALCVGEIVQCYSEERYADPLPLRPGMFLRRGVPKSMYRPGSSTSVLLLQQGRTRFARDLVENLRSNHVENRFTIGFDQPLVETEVKVRSPVAHRVT